MILDHIDNLRFEPDDEDYLFDAQMTLARLSQGLFWLNERVEAAENLAREAAGDDDYLVGVIEGVLSDLPIVWLSCAFQWYAVSLCNYVRLAGWLVSKDTKYAVQYVNRVIPRIKTYRHKVAAHFAITYPKADNEADLISSIMTGIVYAGRRLRAGALSAIVTDDQGNEVKQSHRTSWSMTKTHADLIPRFWPHGPLEAHSSMKISAGATRKFLIDWN